MAEVRDAQQTINLNTNAEFASALDRVSPNELSRKQVQEQQEYIANLQAQLEGQRRLFETCLRQTRRAGLDKLVNTIVEAAFNEAHGGMEARDRGKLAVTARTVNAVPVDIDRAISGARSLAAKTGGNRTPAALLAETGPLRDRTSKVERVFLVVDISDAVLCDSDD